MTDEDQYLADVCHFLGRPAPRFDALRHSEAVTAGVISKDRLIVVSTKSGGRHPVRLDPARSKVFNLQDRSGRAVMVLAREIGSFFRAGAISQLFLRSRTERGKYPGHPLAFKIEAILQLVPGLQVSFVSSHSIRAWVKREEPTIPQGLEDRGAYWNAKEGLATEAALFVAANRENPRYFSDGVPGDD